MMSFSSITEVFRVAMIFMINEVVVCSIVRCSVVPVAKWRSPIAVLSFFGILSQLGYSQQTISQSALIRREATGSLGAKFQLGALPNKQKFKLQLELVNDSDVDFDLQKMQTSCSCIKAVLRENSIKKNDVGHLDVELTTESSNVAKQANNLYAIHLMYATDQGISVWIEYSLSGVVSFRGAGSYLTKVPTNSKEHLFEVPILVTEPVKLNNVSVHGGPLFKDLKTRCFERNGQQFVECRVSVSQGLDASIVEILTIEDKESKSSSRLPVIVEVIPQISIAPNVISFVLSDGDKEYKSRAIVRLNESVLAFDEQQVEFSPRIEASCKDGSVKINQQARMGPGIYRIELTFTAKSEKKDAVLPLPQSLTLKIETPLKSTTRELGVRFAKK